MPHGPLDLSHGTLSVLNLLTSQMQSQRTKEAEAVPDALIIMLLAALGAIVIMVVARPAADRFMRW